jgi:VanZ family protein
LKLSAGYGLAAIGYMTGIFLLSSWQTSHAPASPLVLKLLHLPLFAGLAASLLLGLTQGHWSRAVSWQGYGVIALVAGSYAAFDEWHQSIVPGRSASVGDVLLDCVGITLFLALHRLIAREGAVHEDR